VAHGVAKLNQQEVVLLEEAFRSGARTLQLDIVSTRAGERWFELVMATPASFDVGAAMASLKAVTSRAMHAQRGGSAGFWSLGYVVVSVGDPVDPAEAALKLENNGIRK
jgi:hypothetical protein